MGIHDLFGSNPQLQVNKSRTFSESKNLVNAKKKLAKIDETERKRSTIKDNIYFKTPQKSDGNSFNFKQHRHTTTVYPPPRAPQHLQINSNIGSAQKNIPRHKHDSGHHHGSSAQGRECKCMRRLQNFRLRQRIKTKMNESKVEQTLHEES